MADTIILIVAVFSLILAITAIGSVLVQVPFVPTPRPVVEKMIEFAALKGHETVYDLGCGDARILIEVKRRFPHISAIGYELPLAVWLLARMRILFSGYDVEVRMRDLWTADLRDADVVFLYLLPSVVEKLTLKFDAELKPGTKVISHGFSIKNKEPVKMERVLLRGWVRLWGKMGPRVFLYEW